MMMMKMKMIMMMTTTRATSWLLGVVSLSEIAISCLIGTRTSKDTTEGDDGSMVVVDDHDNDLESFQSHGDFHDSNDDDQP